MTANCGTRHALRMRTEAVHLKATQVPRCVCLSFLVREVFLVWSVAVFVLIFGKTFGDAVLLSFVWVTVQTSCGTPDLLLIQQKLFRWISIRSRVAELVCTAAFAYMLREFHLFFRKNMLQRSVSCRMDLDANDKALVKTQHSVKCHMQFVTSAPNSTGWAELPHQAFPSPWCSFRMIGLKIGGVWTPGPGLNQHQCLSAFRFK